MEHTEGHGDDTKELPKTSVDQYGRKQWDVSAYEADSKRRKTNTRPIAAAVTVDTDKSASYLSHRQDIYTKLTTSVNRFTIVNPLAGPKNNKFGFLCPICDLSYRDNLGLIDHLNSPQHMSKVKASSKSESNEGLPEIDGIKRATVDEVRTMIELLVKRLLAAIEPTESITERIEKRRQFEESKLQRRREKRRQRKSKQSAPENDEVAAAMGFGAFK